MVARSVVQDGRGHSMGVRGLGLTLIVAIMVSGCVTVDKADGSPDALRQAIRTGELVKPGDRVTVVTPAIGERTLTVSQVDDNFIRGENTQVPIDEIVALEKRRVDAVKTAGVIVGGYLGLVLLVAVAAAIALDDAF